MSLDGLQKTDKRLVKIELYYSQNKKVHFQKRKINNCIVYKICILYSIYVCHSK